MCFIIKKNVNQVKLVETGRVHLNLTQPGYNTCQGSRVMSTRLINMLC